jgi:hypothetical protein
MPLMRYFVWVGSVLLALLFIADACLPKFPTAGKTDALPPGIRIYSDQKWPERIVYDTSAPMLRPAPAVNPEAAGSAPPVASPKLREALAELPPQPANPKKPEGTLQRQHKFAKKHAAKPVWLAARRSPFGWLAGLDRRSGDCLVEARKYQVLSIWEPPPICTSFSARGQPRLGDQGYHSHERCVGSWVDACALTLNEKVVVGSIA